MAGPIPATTAAVAAVTAAQWEIDGRPVYFMENDWISLVMADGILVGVGKDFVVKINLYDWSRYSIHPNRVV